MAMDLLVVDSDRAFGELIRQTLEATGLYRVHAATTAADALDLAFQHPIRLAIVDLEQLDTAAEPWLGSLRLANPRLSVFAIPPAGTAEPPAVKVDGVFPKPFYLPDLPRWVSEAVGLPPEAVRPVPFGPPHSSAERQSEPEPEWLSDAGQAQEALTRAALPTAARAVALIRNDRLWALTIPGDSALTRNQLAPLISTASDVHSRGSLTRFFRPPGQKEDFVAYVTPVSRELALIALFGKETPLGGARRTGESLVYSLRHPHEAPPVESVIELPPPKPVTLKPPPPNPVTLEPPPPKPVTLETPPPKTVSIELPPPKSVSPPPEVVLPSAPPADEEPPPSGAVRLPDDWVPGPPEPGGRPSWVDRVLDSVSPPPPPEVPVPPSWPEDWIPLHPALPGVEALLEERIPAAGPPAESRNEPEIEATVGALAMPSDWVPEAPMEAERMPFLEARLPAEAAPAVPAPARLPLFALLVPRLPEHQLTGELAERLQTWTARLCLAWDWIAERIDVRPDRFEVTLILPPDEAPAHALQELRDGLSERVFRSFPELGLDLPSHRFWASPSLLRAGTAPPMSEIDAFLRGTRLAQSRSTAG
jgi:hypothetical protein